MEPAAGHKEAHPGRIAVLDGVRGLAIILVMIHHFFMLYTPDSLEVDRIVFGLAASGWFGVDLFFVLSGFLITGILYDSKGRQRYFIDFYARRTLRIFPLYYGVLFLFFVVLPRVPHPLAQEYIADSASHQLWFWTYLTNFRIAWQGAWFNYLVPNVFWSLAIEEQFYLIWPFVVLMLGRKALINVCVAAFFAALAVRAGLALNGANPLTAFLLTPARMDGLVLGALLALVARGEGGFSRWAVYVPWATGALAGTLILLALPHQGLDWQSPHVNTWGASVVVLCFGSLLVWGVTAPTRSLLRRVLEFRILRLFGKFSYSMYIFHGPAGTAAKTIYDPATAPILFGSALPGVLVYVVLATLMSLAIAWTTWHLLEKWCLAYGRRFRGSRQAPSTTVEVARA